jgi:hypothetical protein
MLAFVRRRIQGCCAALSLLVSRAAWGQGASLIEAVAG